MNELLVAAFYSIGHMDSTVISRQDKCETEVILWSTCHAHVE